MLDITPSPPHTMYSLDVPDVGTALLAGAHPADVLDADLSTPAGCSAAWDELEDALATADCSTPEGMRSAQSARHKLERVEDAVTGFWANVRCAQTAAQNAAAKAAAAHLSNEEWDARRTLRLHAPFEFWLFDDSYGIDTELRGTWMSIPLYPSVRYGWRMRQLFAPSIRMRVHPDDPGRMQGEDGSCWTYARGFGRGPEMCWQSALLRPATPRTGRPMGVLPDVAHGMPHRKYGYTSRPSLTVLPAHGLTVEVCFSRYDVRKVLFSREGHPPPPGYWTLPIMRT